MYYCTLRSALERFVLIYNVLYNVKTSFTFVAVAKVERQQTHD